MPLLRIHYDSQPRAGFSVRGNKDRRMSDLPPGGLLGLIGTGIAALAGGAIWWIRNRPAQEASDSKDRADGEIFRRLTDRINALEARQSVLEERIAEEMKLRLSAQEETARMKVRILTLEHTLELAGVPIPPPRDLAPL
jgi:hypothetical protein